jgi:hypothetical protein
MEDWFGEALQFHLDLDETLALEVEDACERALAHARLKEAIESAVTMIAHPALSLLRRGKEDRECYRLLFLGEPLLEWRFEPNQVELRSWVRHTDLTNVDDELEVIASILGRPAPQKPPYNRFILRYVAHAKEWRMRFAGSTEATHEFTDELEYVFAETIGSVHGLSPWSSPSGVRWFGLQGRPPAPSRLWPP